MTEAPTLERLRDATRALHAELDGMLGVMEPRLDLAAYRDILARFYGFWTGWQPRMAALLPGDVFGPEQRRAALLAADLAALGLSPAAIAALPSCPPPALDSAAAAIGSLYVMEGSTLGGRVIERHVEARLGLTASAGCAYFHGYGQRTGAMWRGLLQRLETVEPMSREVAVAGAVATFLRLIAWMRGDVAAQPDWKSVVLA